MYYINEGTYGSFRWYKEYYSRNIVHLVPSTDDRPVTKATVWGPTCCSTDEVLSDISLPELSIGEWMYFENMGAYTGSVCSNFNGFPTPRSLYYISQSDAAELVSQCSSGYDLTMYTLLACSTEAVESLDLLKLRSELIV